ncbi:MAG: hypothetical protein Ta2D_05720 [Rickettsiales bacterium]|nr:MAG: hypothetical protein Ta2D_05720 [Rickettsiales bacterium]
MNSIENYKNIVDGIFKKKLNVNVSKNTTNNCIGALNSNKEFTVFTTNFKKALERIYNHYKSDAKTVEEILNTLKQLGESEGYKWAGFYSEIIALDYFIQCKILGIKYQNKYKNGDNIYENSLAKITGGKEVDIDLYLKTAPYSFYLDVKSLIPVHFQLIDNIIKQVKQKTTIKDAYIAVNDFGYTDYLSIQKDLEMELNNKSGLIKNLIDAVDRKESSIKYRLNSGMNIEFTIGYPPCVNITERVICPYQFALNYRYRILDYYNKLLLEKPTFIVFVKHPWFNNEIEDFDCFDEKFYRSFARRVFMELTKDDDYMSKYYEKDFKNSTLKVKDIASLISGIIFIDDKSVLKTDTEAYKTFIFLNPNAKNKQARDFYSMIDFINQPYYLIDNFEYDNY